MCKMAEEPPVKKARVLFGSGEEKTNDLVNATAGGSGLKGNGVLSEAVLAGIRAGNINISSGAH